MEPELLYVKSLNNGLVKVTDKCCKKKEHCVLCHEGFGQSVPPETIVHILSLIHIYEGELFIGCAGGANTTAEFTYQPVSAPQDYFYFRVTVKG